jgi:Uri superfamily endonuclease
MDHDVAEIVGAGLGPDYALIDGGGDDAPTEKGAYVLILRLKTPVSFPWRKRRVELLSGWYVYAGSGNGPGGIRGRLRHHLRPEKTPHWHIDHLTNIASPIRMFVGISGSECDIIARLSAVPGFEMPLKGFGSSDCRTCGAHLLSYGPCSDG